MGDMIRCHRCGTHHYRNDPCPDYDSRCGDPLRDTFLRADRDAAVSCQKRHAALSYALADRLAALGQSAWVIKAFAQVGLEPPALATREATGKD